MPIKTHNPANSITHGRLVELLTYDPQTGDFMWRQSRNSYGGRVAAGSVVKGYMDRYGYRIIGLDRKRYQASRLAWFYTYGVWPDGEVDHKDRNPLNNAMDNLRDAGRTQQRGNQKVRKDSTSGVKGVQPTRHGNWTARCRGKSRGTFKTIAEAQEAYLKAAEQAFGEFARAA